ncbi:PAS domain S-box protein [Paenibacillus sp. YYML68]|uniref:PAS domain S-box protein n=1 Tax=Paenibacillus sp. YYML68 TaxID=2909250 RepID=UPI002492F8E7|nr:PAS domain S-box protein [Paenibacillus sp. YYML68]
MAPIVYNELELYRNAFLYDSVGKAIVNYNGDWVKVNASFCRLLGYSERELQDTNFYELFFKEPSVGLLNEIFENDNEYIELELHFEPVTDKPIWLMMVITLIGLAHKPHHFIVQIMDITARKSYERKIHRMNTEINLILDSVNEGIFGFDTNTSSIYWNQAAERMTGFRKEEISFDRLHDLIHHTNWEGEHLEMKDCPIFTAIQQGDRLYLPNELFWHKDGSSFPVEVAVNPIIDNDVHVGSVITFTDISERMKSKELLIRSEKLSIAGQLAAGIAHEIRNPLTSLKGFIRLIQSSDSPSKQRFYLNIMDEELHRIEHILSELLMLAKPQSTCFSFSDLSETIQQVVSLLQPQALLKNMELIYCPQAARSEIYCDPNQIKQVIINLIKNAMEASAEDTTIRITLCSDDTSVYVSVQDEGPGMTQELMDKLGEPFVTTKERGTGLGLMVSYSIIRNHQGTIDVSSTVGEGTTFTISLPFEQVTQD